MARSGSGSFNPVAYATVNWSWKATEYSDYMKVDFTISLTATGLHTAQNPKLMLYGIPGTPFDSSTITDVSGNSMKNFVTSHGGAQSMKDLGSQSYPGTQVIHRASLSFNVQKTTSARNVKLYFGSAVQSTYWWDILAGEVTQTLDVPSSYVPPSNLNNPRAYDITTTSFTAMANWTGGTGADGMCYVTANGQRKLINNDPVTFTGLTPNTAYTVKFELSEVDHSSTIYDTATITATTLIAPPSGWVSVTSSTTSITASATSPNGGSFKYQYRINGGAWQDSGTFSGLTPNTNYTIEARCYSNSQGTASTTISTSRWTYPALSSPLLSLKSGSEHNTILVSAKVSGATSNAQYAYRIDNGSWSGWTTASSYSFSGLAGHSTHTIGVKMRNSSSGLESSEVTGSITTWYNPLTNLKVNLVNRWFWYLLINCSFNYQGGTSNISKYEFDIGGQGYQNKGTSNSHSRGSTSPTGSGKLNYNTDYVCNVRVTDNHGRTYTATATFKTMDERCLYVDGVLREVKVINSDGSISYVTPNLLTVVNENGTTVNMNKIINNDNRTSYS